MVDPKRVLEDYLVTSARLGDRAAMAELVALRGPRIMSHAVRLLGDAEEARDVVQETWIDIFRGLKNLNDVRAFPAWAMRIATRRCARVIRRQQGQRALKSAVANDVECFVSESGTERVRAMQVRRAIAELPGEQAAAIALFYLEDMSVAEVAIALDVPVGTVKTRLMHARAKLKQALEGENNEQGRAEQARQDD